MPNFITCPDCKQVFDSRGYSRHPGSARCIKAAEAYRSSSSNTQLSRPDYIVERSAIRPINSLSHNPQSRGNNDNKRESDNDNNSQYHCTPISTVAADRSEDKVPCDICGVVFNKKGLGRHRKACAEKNGKIWVNLKQQRQQGDNNVTIHDKVICEYCGLKFEKRGIGRHRKACAAKQGQEWIKLKDARESDVNRVIREQKIIESKINKTGDCSNLNNDKINNNQRDSDSESKSNSDQHFIKSFLDKRRISSENMKKQQLCVKPTQSGKTFEIIRDVEHDINRFNTGEVGDSSDHGKLDIHIIFAYKTLLNVEQLVTRVVNEVTIAQPGEVIVLASKNVCGQSKFCRNYTWVKNIEELMRLSYTPKVVICCGHFVRFGQIFEILFRTEVLSNDNFHGCFPKNARYTLHFDESHELINRVVKFREKSKTTCDDETDDDDQQSQLPEGLFGRIVHEESMRNCISKSCGLSCVSRICHYTATPNKLFSSNDPFWAQFHLKPLMQKEDAVSNLKSNYFGYDNMEFIICKAQELITTDSESEAMAPEILRQRAKEIFHVSGGGGGARIFVPAGVRVKSHNAVRHEILAELCPEAIVIVLNGKEKSMTFRSDSDGRDTNSSSSSQLKFIDLTDERRIPQLKGKEISDKVDYILRIHCRLDPKRPIVTTGFLCLNVGQTLIHRGYGNFTAAVITVPDREIGTDPKLRMLYKSEDPDNVYQQVGRLTGRYAGWGAQNSSDLDQLLRDSGYQSHQNGGPSRTKVYCTKEVQQIFEEREKQAFGVMEMACSSSSGEAGDKNPLKLLTKAIYENLGKISGKLMLQRSNAKQLDHC